MSLKSKLIMYPTIVILGLVAAAGFSNLPSRKSMYDEIMVVLSVTVHSETRTIPVKIEYRVNSALPTPDTSLRTWTKRLPVRRGDLVFLAAEQFEVGRMACVIQVPYRAPVSNETVIAERITCATSAL